ncbi:FUSC family protein [Methylocella sp.]|uniref:FUSC family protein n=1 Tax=Methylocella sp. TaxID=1978226 RepID=UPI0037832DC6
MGPYSLRDWAFSLKTFAAAAAALYICFALQLERPYWAVATVYICSQPLSGATRSKAFYRAFGTLLGAAAGVAIVPNLVNAPELMSFAVALWIAGCLYLAVLDRTPRSYMFMLAGYTAAIVGFPSVDAPGAIFDVAVARVEEIFVGLVCASLFSSLVFPQHVAPLLAERLASSLKDADLWAAEALAGVENSHALRLRLAADAAQLDQLSVHLAFDASIQSHAARATRLLRLRLLLLTPVIVAVADRVRGLAGEAAQETLALARALGERFAAGEDASADEKARLARLVADRERRVDASASTPAAIELSLLLRLQDLLALRGDCRLLREQIESGAPRLKEKLSFNPPAGAAEMRHRDHFAALLAAATVFICVGGVCVFWIATDWPHGATAALCAAVVCCIFATLDEPAPALRAFALGSAGALGVAAAYLFAILPRAQTFEALILALAPAFVAFGLMATRPKTAVMSVALSLWTATLMALTDNYAADFAELMNSGLALLGGVWASMLAFGLVEAAGAPWRLERLVRANRLELAAAAEGRGGRDRAHFAALMLDRLALAASCVAAPGAASAESELDAPAVRLMRGLRVGLNIIELRVARRALPAAAPELDALLAALARFFRAPAGRAPGPEIDALIERALSRLVGEPAGEGRRAGLVGLIGLRRTLFAGAADGRANASTGRNGDDAGAVAAAA